MYAIQDPASQPPATGTSTVPAPPKAKPAPPAAPPATACSAPPKPSSPTRTTRAGPAFCRTACAPSPPSAAWALTEMPGPRTAVPERRHREATENETAPAVSGPLAGPPQQKLPNELAASTHQSAAAGPYRAIRPQPEALPPTAAGLARLRPRGRLRLPLLLHRALAPRRIRPGKMRNELRNIGSCRPSGRVGLNR